MLISNVKDRYFLGKENRRLLDVLVVVFNGSTHVEKTPNLLTIDSMWTHFCKIQKTKMKWGYYMSFLCLFPKL